MTRITVAKGDGIGPEIMDATLKIIKAAGASLEFDEIEVGESVYLAGNTAGIKKESWDTLIRNKIFLKAPITTPQGGGYKSLNVTTRKMLGLFANVRPNMSFYPYVDTKNPKLDLVIIRENEEDLYAGIEHQQTDEVVQCLKLISRPGCEKIVRYAFEYAAVNGRKKVTCFTKDNIMKQTDGLFHSVFDEIAREYPAIENEHWIVDIGAAKMADTPEAFDVIVTLNLYGDILSDVVAQLSGSVGLAGSANIGEEYAMFEAIHGSAPRRAGLDVANPSGLLNGAIMMLNHIGQTAEAALVHNALLKTLEDGIHTYDIFRQGHSVRKVGTKEFADEVIKRIGQVPEKLPKKDYTGSSKITLTPYKRRPNCVKELQGVDVFIQWNEPNADALGREISKILTPRLKLSLISNRGIKVWPEGFKETFCTDHWRCRFTKVDSNPNAKDVLEIQQKLIDAGYDVIKTENLYAFNGKIAFSLGQGQ